MTRFKARGCDAAKVIQVVVTEALRGNGVDDPLRTATQYWSLDGVLLAEGEQAYPAAEYWDGADA